MERKLVSIQAVKALEPIPGADNIELAHIEGWRCVVRKGDFKVGDWGCFHEVDSLLPHTDDPATTDARYEFMRARHFRVKSMKLKGCLSQGLLMPVDLWKDKLLGKTLQVGDDVTAALGVTKYEPPITFRMGDALGDFPAHVVPKTDEMRLQSYMALLDEMKGMAYDMTVKVDGTSGTFLWDDLSGGLVCCSRNLMMKEGDNLYWRVAEQFKLKDILGAPKNRSYVIQGEIAGPGIQKNRAGFATVGLYVFDVYDRETRSYLGRDAVQGFCFDFGLPIVQLAHRGDAFDFTLEKLLEMAETGRWPNGSGWEGLVVRPQNPVFSPTLQGRLSFKVLNNRYLLKNEE